MRLDLLEKLVYVLSGVVITLVAIAVALLSLQPWRSGIPDVAVASAEKTIGWLEQRRAGGQGGARHGREEVLVQALPAAVTGGGPAAGGAPASQPTNDYFVKESSGSSLPPGEVIEGYPWLRKVPGVTYLKPKRVPDILYRKYQSYEDSFQLAQEGGGEFVTASSGEDAYQVNWLNEQSLLGTTIGLKPGDKVISINGMPVGNSIGAGRALYEQLRGETHFAVLVERQGQRTLLSYYVQ